MDVKLLRIDSRLVHGQVANNWAGSLGAEASSCGVRWRRQ